MSDYDRAMTMQFNALVDRVERLVKEATNPMLFAPDFEKNLELVDLCNNEPVLSTLPHFLCSSLCLDRLFIVIQLNTSRKQFASNSPQITPKSVNYAFLYHSPPPC